MGQQHKPVTECGRWSGCGDVAGCWWPSGDAVCGTGSRLHGLCGLKLLLLVLLELASDATLCSVLTARPPAAAAGNEGLAFDVKDGL